MKLYYVVDKWKVDNTNVIVPFYYVGDCNDTEFYEYIKLDVFTEDQLFEKHVLENYDKNISIREHRHLGRIFSIYSIDTDDLPENFSIETCKFYHKLSIKNTETSWTNYNTTYSYNSNYYKLNWQLVEHICVNTTKLKASLTNFPDDPYGDLNKLINIICGGDNPDRLVRLNTLQKMWNNDTESARELYDILCDFTFGDYYDINAEGYAYYREMRYLRDIYNVDPERSKHDKPIEYNVGDSIYKN